MKRGKNVKNASGKTSWKVRQSDIDEIKRIATSFLYETVVENTSIPFAAHHPFFDSIWLLYEDQIVNIMDNEEAFLAICRKREEQIWKINEVELFFGLITKPFRLLFLKETKEFMTQKDFSESLKFVWTSCEDPNQDLYVDVDTIISWFYESDKNFLMGKEELTVFYQFPEEINIYRGVAVYRNPDGISWTMDSKTAEWFAHRFDTGKQHGYVRTGMIDKRHILAYFDERGEKEIVIDRNYLRDYR